MKTNKSTWIVTLTCICMLSINIAIAVDFSVIVVDKKGRSSKGTIIELVAHNKAKAKSIEIGQTDKEFDTFVSIVPVGSSVSFLNHDSVKHHVYSVSKNNTFDIPLYSGTPPKDIVFNKAGVVKIGCNIHDWMLSFVYVNESKYIDTTNEKGHVTFLGLPKGKYQLRVWNPRFRNNKKVLVENLDIYKNGTKNVKVSLLYKVHKPKRDLFRDLFSVDEDEY